MCIHMCMRVCTHTCTHTPLSRFLLKKSFSLLFAALCLLGNPSQRAWQESARPPLRSLVIELYTTLYCQDDDENQT